MRILCLILVILLGVFATGCDNSVTDGETNVSETVVKKYKYVLDYTSSKRISYDGKDCIAVFTDFENNTENDIKPFDNVDINTYQHDVNLPCLVPTGEEIDGYIQCDTTVKANSKAKVVWLFQLQDNSKVTIKTSGGYVFYNSPTDSQ